MTSSPVSSTWTPPGQVPSARWARTKPAISARMSSKWRVLRPPAEVKVLPCIGSQAHTTGWPASRTARRSGRSRVLDAVGAHAGDEREAAGDAGRVERLAQLQHLVGVGVGPSLHADRVADAAEELDVGAVELAGALADPQHVGRAVVPVAGERVLAGERLLVAEDQRLVARVDVDLVELRAALEVDPAGPHEPQRPLDLVGEGLVALALPAAGRRTPASRRGPGTGRRSRPW